MTKYEILSRASAFLLASKTTHHVHVLCSSHVVSPWLWENYYPQKWLKETCLQHVQYSLDVIHGNSSLLETFPCLSSPIHHPEGYDMAMIHLVKEKEALFRLLKWNVQVLDLEDAESCETGQFVYIDGYHVTERDDGKETLDGTHDDTRVFVPYSTIGNIVVTGKERCLAKTESPLPEGLCGGLIVSIGRVVGIIEGILPINHKKKCIAGATAFLTSGVIREFVHYSETSDDVPI